jgi:hypothetical protein
VTFATKAAYSLLMPACVDDPQAPGKRRRAAPLRRSPLRRTASQQLLRAESEELDLRERSRQLKSAERDRSWRDPSV